jgi:hypothetical protein
VNIERVTETVAELRLFNHLQAANLLETTAKALGQTLAVLDWEQNAHGIGGTRGFLEVITGTNPPRDKTVRMAWKGMLKTIEDETAKRTP